MYFLVFIVLVASTLPYCIFTTKHPNHSHQDTMALSISSSSPHATKLCIIIHKCVTNKNFMVETGNDITEDVRSIVQGLAMLKAPHKEELRTVFLTLYGQKLSEMFQAHLHGSLRDALSLWIVDAAERDVIIARKALHERVPDIFALIEILCARNPTQIVQTREAYFSLFKTPLEDDIAAEIVGGHQKLLFALAKARRYPSTHVDECLAKSDAKRWFEATKGRIGIDEASIIKLLSERSLNHLKTSFIYYNTFYGHHILKALQSKTSNKFGETLRIVLECIWAPERYFCKLIRRSLVGQVDKSVVVRVMVTRGEEGIDEIKKIYCNKYGVSLDEDIATHACSPMRELLVSLSSTRVSS